MDVRWGFMEGSFAFSIFLTVRFGTLSNVFTGQVPFLTLHVLLGGGGGGLDVGQGSPHVAAHSARAWPSEHSPEYMRGTVVRQGLQCPYVEVYLAVSGVRRGAERV